MERLTYDFSINGIHFWQVHGADNELCEDVCKRYAESGCANCPIGHAFDRLAAIEDILGDDYNPARLRELAQADREGRCVVLEEKMLPLIWGDVFHNTILCPNCEKDLMGGFSDDGGCDVPMFQCPYCGQPINTKKVLTRELAEAALEAQKGADEDGK